MTPRTHSLSAPAFVAAVAVAVASLLAGCTSTSDGPYAPAIHGPVEAFDGRIVDMDEHSIPTRWATDTEETPGPTMAVPYHLVFVRTGDTTLILVSEDRPAVELDTPVHGEYLRTGPIDVDALVLHRAPRMPRSWGRVTGAAYDGRLIVDGLLTTVRRTDLAARSSMHAPDVVR